MADESTGTASEPEPTPQAGTEPATPAGQEPTDGAAPWPDNDEAESIATAAHDPYGADARGAAEALRSGRRTLRVDGAAAIIDRSTIKNLITGDQYTLFGREEPSTVASSVRADVLSRVRDCYVTVPRHDTMLATLSEYRLLLLRGLPGTGRSTTAVQLLDELARDKVSRLELTDGLDSLRPKDLANERGYVLELPVSGRGRQPTNTDLDRLRDLLDARKCWCVLLGANVETSGDPIGDYACAYAPPDPEAVLRAHVRRQLRLDDPADTEHRLVELATGGRLRAAVGPNPRPVDIVRMADLLVRHSRRKLTIDEVVEGCGESVRDQVVSWFGGHWTWRSRYDDELFRIAAFRIALAVLHGSTYDVVAENADSLAILMITAAAGPRHVMRTSPFAGDRDSRLARCRAHMVAGSTSFGEISIETTFVEFEDDRYPAAVLGYVWDTHHDLRSLIVEWLSDLGRDPRVFVSIRAALAAGLLSALDLQYGYHKLIAPGAVDPDQKARRFAAVALNQAAQGAKIRKAVLGFQRHWRHSQQFELRWTAAAALGYDLGREWIDTALEQLRVLGTPDERLHPLRGRSGDSDVVGMLDVTSYSLAQLLAFGAVKPVLDQLSEWLRHRRTSARDLANWTMVRLIVMKGFQLGGLDMSGSRDHWSVRPGVESWPVLLVLIDGDPRLTEPIATLLRDTFRGPRGEVVAGYLAGWIRTGQEDHACLAALLRFIPYLVADVADAARLKHVVARMPGHWAEPLDPDVAATVMAAISPKATRENSQWTAQTG